jgi:transcription initiation protein SPT3
MFVFGEIQEPLPDTVNLVENIIRSQLVELVSPFAFPIRLTSDIAAQIVQARALANRRNARYLCAEDLIFLIRHDRAKVNRLRTYLSWKEVRKHAKDSNADGGGGVEVETLEDGTDGTVHLYLTLFPNC